MLPAELLGADDGARIVALEIPEEMVTVFEADAEQPEAFVTVTLKLPDAVAENDWLVAPPIGKPLSSH